MSSDSSHVMQSEFTKAFASRIATTCAGMYACMPHEFVSPEPQAFGRPIHQVLITLSHVSIIGGKLAKVPCGVISTISTRSLAATHRRILRKLITYDPFGSTAPSRQVRMWVDLMYQDAVGHGIFLFVIKSTWSGCEASSTSICP